MQEESDKFSCHRVAVLHRIIRLKLLWEVEETQKKSYLRQNNLIHYQIKVSEFKRI